MNSDLLFVYGSLLDSTNQFGDYLKSNAQFIGNAVFKGRLFDCGAYPGAIIDNAGYNVRGCIYRLSTLKTALPILDDYEGFGEDQEQPNLFIRELVTVDYNSEIIECWIYLYNLPFDGLTEISSGDYISYINS